MMNTFYQEIRFYKKDNPSNYYEGFILDKDCESCTVSFKLEGSDATIVLFYDEWCLDRKI